jgi:threonine/homoserine/homoserine lactone efflux protein
MPDTGTLLLFTLVAAGFVAVPGPSNLYVLGRGLQSGTRAAIAGAGGCGSGATVYVAATAAGLSALIASSQILFAVLHYAGASYLCWLGVSVWRSADRAAAPVAAGQPASVWRSYRQGLLVQLGNPKAALFFLALFPQFIHHGAGPAALQALFLGAVFVTVGFASDCVYAIGSGRLRSWLVRKPGRLPRQQRLTGAIYVGLGLWAALAGTGRANAQLAAKT